MTSSSDLRRVVVDPAASHRVRPARISADLRTSPFAGRFEVDPRLLDPALVAVVAQAEERARQAGWAAGHQEGLAIGRQEAAAEAQTQAHAAAARVARREEQLDRLGTALTRAVADLDARDAVVFEEIDHVVAVMAVGLAEVLVGRHLELQDVPALDAVHRALALAPRHARVLVHVHPDAVADLPDLAGALPGGSVTIVADPSVEPDGCIVEAGNRTIDAQLGPALERLREVLR